MVEHEAEIRHEDICRVRRAEETLDPPPVSHVVGFSLATDPFHNKHGIATYLDPCLRSCNGLPFVTDLFLSSDHLSLSLYFMMRLSKFVYAAVVFILFIWLLFPWVE